VAATRGHISDVVQIAVGSNSNHDSARIVLHYHPRKPTLTLWLNIKAFEAATRRRRMSDVLVDEKVPLLPPL